MGYPAIGDKFTTNCFCYDDGEFANDDELLEALAACNETPVYAGVSEIGAWKLSAEKPEGVVAKVIKSYTMPDGQYGAKLHILGC